MDKLSFHSTNDPALSIGEKQEFTINKSFVFSVKQMYFKSLSEISVRLINFHRARARRYKNMLKNLGGPAQPSNTSDNSNKPRKVKGSSISKEILEAVLLKLNAFEQQKGYLDSTISLNELSRQLETNSSYLSKIINRTKGKSFKHYLNDLRIAHAFEELNNNPQKRKFTIEAIAFDFGFRSAESFSKKFRAAYGVYPSKFMRELNKN
ncbi:MAG: AraC family transcriptional regulator [Bacteroidota bacterium]